MNNAVKQIEKECTLDRPSGMGAQAVNNPTIPPSSILPNLYGDLKYRTIQIMRRYVPRNAPRNSAMGCKLGAIPRAARGGESESPLRESRFPGTKVANRPHIVESAGGCPIFANSRTTKVGDVIS